MLWRSGGIASSTARAPGRQQQTPRYTPAAWAAFVGPLIAAAARGLHGIREHRHETQKVVSLDFRKATAGNRAGCVTRSGPFAKGKASRVAVFRRGRGFLGAREAVYRPSAYADDGCMIALLRHSVCAFLRRGEWTSHWDSRPSAVSARTPISPTSHNCYGASRRLIERMWLALFVPGHSGSGYNSCPL